MNLITIRILSLCRRILLFVSLKRMHLVPPRNYNKIRCVMCENSVKICAQKRLYSFSFNEICLAYDSLLNWLTVIDWLTDSVLTLSPPIPLRLYTLPYLSNRPFLIFDIRALWRSELSARVPECQKLKMVG